MAAADSSLGVRARGVNKATGVVDGATSRKEGGERSRKKRWVKRTVSQIFGKGEFHRENTAEEAGVGEGELGASRETRSTQARNTPSTLHHRPHPTPSPTCRARASGAYEIGADRGRA